MKANKSFSLDMEMIEKLTREDNPSKLVNELLNKHFNLTKEKVNKLSDEEKAIVRAEAIKIRDAKEVLKSYGLE